MDNNFENSSFEEISDEKKGVAIAILILGICSIVCCGCLGLILAIIAIILFVVNKDKIVENKKLAKAGLICSIVGIVVSLISSVISAVMTPTYLALLASMGY